MGKVEIHVKYGQMEGVSREFELNVHFEEMAD